MTGKSIIVPDYREVEGNVVFLAGPIQGAEDWHKVAREYLMKNGEISVASPRGDYSARKFDYNVQVDWESFYLNRAAEKGVVLFWLAKEKEHTCKRSYAQTTRFELAEWVTKHKFKKKINIALGIEPGFTGERYIRKRVGEDCPEIKICSALEETCNSALELLGVK